MYRPKNRSKMHPLLPFQSFNTQSVSLIVHCKPYTSSIQLHEHGLASTSLALHFKLISYFSHNVFLHIKCKASLWNCRLGNFHNLMLKIKLSTYFFIRSADEWSLACTQWLKTKWILLWCSFIFLSKILKYYVS